MKYIVLLTLGLTSCSGMISPKFKVGDCVKITHKREFKRTFYELYKIKDIGKDEYLTIGGYSDDAVNIIGRLEERGEFILLVDEGEKVECKGRLK